LLVETAHVMVSPAPKRACCLRGMRRRSSHPPPRPCAQDAAVTMAGLMRAYDRALNSSPLLTKTVTSFVLFGVGDVMSQKLEGKAALDWVRTGRMATWGALFTPLAHLWYLKLDQWIPGKGERPTRRDARGGGGKGGCRPHLRACMRWLRKGGRGVLVPLPSPVQREHTAPQAERRPHGRHGSACVCRRAGGGVQGGGGPADVDGGHQLPVLLHHRGGLVCKQAMRLVR
jgi:hypothetical protein